DDAKKKWRSLRDQFLKEIKKIPTCRSGSSQEYAALYKGKWGYFNSMLFLKDTAVPRVTDGNISDINVDADEDSEEPDEIDDFDQTSTSSYNISSPPSTSFTTQANHKRKKKQDTSRNFEQHMSPVQKLRVRNEIQNILIRESLPPQQYLGSANSHNQNYILPSVSTIHPTFSSMPSSSQNFQYSDDTHSNI
ncbi:transcription factor Adf-1-like, partial [Aphis craccivora]